MRGEWCYYKQVFSAETCNKIIKLAEQIPSQRARIGTDSGVHVQDDYRRSDIKFIEKSNTDFSWLFDSLWKMVIEANDTWFKFNISKLDYIQLAEYNADELGEYKQHHDVFWMNGDPSYHRKLTCVVQLTDPKLYTGGELELYDLAEYPNSEEIKMQGTAIFFPAFTTHAALPITKGVRHSLACWFDGPKWT